MTREIWQSEAPLPEIVEMENGEVYVAVMMRIVSRDEDGRPQELQYLPDDVAIESWQGDEFLVAYIKREMIQR